MFTSTTSKILGSEAPVDQFQAGLLRAELAAAIDGARVVDGSHRTATARLLFARASQSRHPVNRMCDPAFCVLAQDGKRVLLVQKVYIYDRSQYLVAVENPPVSRQLIDASPEAPYLGIRLNLDVKGILMLALELRLGGAHPSRASDRAIFTGALSARLLDPILRLVRLLDTPGDIPALAQLFSQGIWERLLKSPGASSLAQMAMSDSHRATGRAGDRPADAAVLPTATRRCPRGRSSHARVVTAPAHQVVSLRRARLSFRCDCGDRSCAEFMLSEHVDAATAGNHAGCWTQSHFIPKYRRFLTPQARDVKRLRSLQLGRVRT